MGIYDKIAKRKSGRDDDDDDDGDGGSGEKTKIVHFFRCTNTTIYCVYSFRTKLSRRSGKRSIGRRSAKMSEYILCFVCFASEIELFTICVRSTFRMLVLNNQLRFVVRMNEPNMNSDGPRNSFIIIIFFSR